MGYSRKILRLGALFLLVASQAWGKIEFKQDSFTFTATLNEELRIDLSSLLKDPTTKVDRWATSKEKPAWLTLDSDNHVLFGTVADASIEKFTFTLTARTGDVDAATSEMSVNVLAPPTWAFDDIDLGIQNEGLLFKHDLKEDIKENPTGGAMKFSSNNLPSWMQLTQDGILTGTPARKNVGVYEKIHIAVQGDGGSSNASAHGQVIKTIHPPTWTANPVPLPDVKEDSSFSADLSTFVLNQERTALTFSLSSPVPPPWLHLTSTGTLYGVPGAEDVKVVSTEVTVQTIIDNVPYSAKTMITFTVKHVNHAPQWLANPLNLPQAQAQAGYLQDLSLSASDPDKGDSLTYSLVSGPPWAIVSAAGKLSGTPTNANVGDNTFVVSAKDKAGLEATTSVIVNVKRAIQPPVWKSHPVMLGNAEEDKAYSVDLTQYATDSDGNAMFFSLISGPSWLHLSENGILSGTAGAQNIGPNKLTVQVSDHLTQGGDITDLFVQVDHTNHPPEWTLNPIFISTPEEKPFSSDISEYANDKDLGDDTKLVFSAVSGPAWAQLSPQGTFSGTPTMANEGENQYVVRVADASGATADVRVVIEVTHVNHAPVWTENPVTLTNAKEDTAYSASLASLATDVDKDALVFSKLSGPEWIILTSDGKIQGTPTYADVGLKSFVVEVRDPSNALATATVNLTVDKLNHAPYWRQNPVLLGNALEDQMFKFDLKIYAADRDGDKLTFEKVSGPDWISVSPVGGLSGVPQKKDVGQFKVTLRVSDSELTADVDATGTVMAVNHPPVIAAEGPAFIVKERQTFESSLSTFIKDPDGDSVTCNLIDTADWVSLSSDCKLMLAPKHKEIGDHTFQFSASDGELSANGKIRVTVVRDPRAPECQDPVTFVAKTNEAFSEAMADRCRDLDGLKLTFSKKDGKDWLSVNEGGDLTGTPKEADFGKEKFTVAACNDALCTNANVVIDVQYGTKIDTIQIDAPVPNAPAEQLWVVDNSSRCSPFVQQLKYHIGTFYAALAKAQIHHSGILISSDAREFNGLPITYGEQPPVMDWNEKDVTNDFRRRVDAAYSGGPCSNCDNSPIWSMFDLYTQAPTLTEWYKKTYFLPNQPMDALLVTNQLDHFRWYAQRTPQANDTPDDYAKSFIEFHESLPESYRISALAPQCHGYLEGSLDRQGEDPYRVLVTKTKGKFYPIKCQFDMAKVLNDYAQQIIFRAYVYAKGRIKLEKKPLDPLTLNVTLGSELLPGNTGAETDLWSYDAASNEVVIRWNAMDASRLKAGEKLVIEYRIS